MEVNRLISSSISHLSTTVGLGRRQPCPSPVPARAWCVQWHGWRQLVHISVLDLTAFFRYLCMKAAGGSRAPDAFFHIFRSVVAATVTAKGRSSSLHINRVSRGLTSLLFCADLVVPYPVDPFVEFCRRCPATS